MPEFQGIKGPVGLAFEVWLKDESRLDCDILGKTIPIDVDSVAFVRRPLRGNGVSGVAN
jgi:hypothetical protein